MIRLGLVAAGRITEPAAVDPVRLVDGVEITVIGARDRARADEAAERWSIPHGVGSWEEVWTHAEVDAVYIATPAGHHLTCTLGALHAGCHVLCEKPLAANADEARRMVDAAERADRMLMEAFHWRYHPMVDQMRRIVDSGRLGDITHAEARFDLPEGRIARTDIRWDPTIGGGSLMDLGCYPVQWLRWLFGDSPTVTDARAETPVAGIDARMEAHLAWPSGATAQLSSSMIEPDGRTEISLTVVGSRATMRAENPLAPQFGAHIDITGPDDSERFEVENSATYTHQMAAFVEAVHTGRAPVTSGADSIDTMRVIDEIYVAAGMEPRSSPD
jgi:predicted dehydrogenase